MYTTTAQDLGPGLAANLGLYVQICARIEYQVASIICAIEKRPEDTEEWRSRHNTLRWQHSTKELISKLSTSAKRLENNHSWKSYLSEISGWMHRFVGNRHKAVHGFITKEGDGLVVRAANKDSNEESVLSVSAKDIAEMMDDAQRILDSLERCFVFLTADRKK
jgi:hypothetical protein